MRSRTRIQKGNYPPARVNSFIFLTKGAIHKTELVLAHVTDENSMF